jgi:polyhydroxybutyrate depolymerase
MGSRPHRWHRLLPISVLVLALVAACGDDASPELTGSTGTPTDDGVPGEQLTVPLGDRPFTLFVPSGYRAGQAAPLVIGLHGYSSNSGEMSAYFGLVKEAEERGFLAAMPDGTRDQRGEEFWNATDACCDLYHTGVDDSAYLSSLIDTVGESYDVSGVFLIGHSNGGFMAHRMACEHAEQITGIAALAGVVWQDPARCAPSRPVSVLQIHGTADRTVLYPGGTLQDGAAHPGAEATVAQWRDKDGCTDTAQTAPPRDLDELVAGAETTITTYADGCDGGTKVELWRMEGSGHVPGVNDDFTPGILDFFDSLAS